VAGQGLDTQLCAISETQDRALPATMDLWATTAVARHSCFTKLCSRAAAELCSSFLDLVKAPRGLLHVAPLELSSWSG